MGLENLVAQKTTQLRQSERKYRTLYESSRDALVLVTPQQKFISGNLAAVKLFGSCSQHEFTPKTLDQCSPHHQLDESLSSSTAQQMLDIALKEDSHFSDCICTRSDVSEFF